MTGKRPSSYYPVFLNVAGRKCVVVGGGDVALRKVKALLARRAQVQVISPDLCAELSELSDKGEIAVLPRDYQTGDLRGALIAVAATNYDRVNSEVAKEARRAGALANVVDDIEKSDFIVPSCLERGNITIAISTGGSSPALARAIRTRLEKEFAEEYASLALLVEEVRSELGQKGIKIDGSGWQQALELDVMIDLLKKGHWKKAKSVLLEGLEGLCAQGHGL